MNNYNLRFKRRNERGYWNVTINAKNDEEALKETKKYLDGKDYIEKAILEKTYYRYKKIYEEKF